MNKTEFNKWVDKMITEYRKTAKRFTMGVNDYTGTTVCGDDKTGKCAMARCHPNDNYSYSYGKAIAYARCRGYAVPKLTTYKKLSEMKHDDRFLGTFDNKIYAFISKSTLYNTYIVENITDRCICYHVNDDEEYEMVE